MDRYEEIKARWQAVKNKETWARDVMHKYADRDIPWLLDEVERLTGERDAAMKITGETSDGYHTFNDLYHHRAVLFSLTCNDRPEMAWKSQKHHDGTMFRGMFIVGIETPEGQATYHYDIDPYWEIFKVKGLECAPEWDGHTPAQAIERIARLHSVAIERDAAIRRAEEIAEKAAATLGAPNNGFCTHYPGYICDRDWPKECPACIKKWLEGGPADEQV